MKKLIIVLMMVAMASFLFVGCLSGTTTPATTTTTTTTPTVTTPVTKAPVITAVGGVVLTSSATQYVNRGESPVTGIVVSGTAPTYSEIKVYLDGKVAGTADATAAGLWAVTITLTELGTDGAKVLDADAKEPGADASAKSNEVKFILDRKLPTMTSVAGYIGADHYKVNFSEAVDISIDYVTGASTSALDFANWDVNGTVLVADDILTAVSTRVIKFELPTTSASTVNSPAIWTATSQVYSFECDNVEDVAGNPISATSIIYGTLLL